MVLAEQFFEEHALRFQFVFAHCFSIDFESRLQVLVPENLLHCLDVDFHLYQDRSKRSAKGVEAKRTCGATTPAFLAAMRKQSGTSMFAVEAFFPLGEDSERPNLRLRGGESPCATQEDVSQATDASAQVPSAPSTWVCRSGARHTPAALGGAARRSPGRSIAVRGLQRR